MWFEPYLQALVVTFLGIIGWGGKKVLDRLDGIEKMLASEVRALSGIQHSMDVRLTRVEERCSIVMDNASGLHRRATDTQPTEKKTG